MFVIAIFVSQLSGFDGYRPKLEFFRVYMQFQTLNKRVQKSFREENENAQKIILNRRKPNLFFFQNQNLMENTEALQLVMVEQKKSKWSTEVNQRKTKLKCDDC
jgi:ABC-type lipoprotein export system ATPase subunit